MLQIVRIRSFGPVQQRMLNKNLCNTWNLEYPDIGLIELPFRLSTFDSAKAVRFMSRLAQGGFCSYTNSMRITVDPAKRERTLAERGLDFEDASVVFEGVTVEIEDRRKNYDERRIVCYGMLKGRLVVIGYTPRG